jgi:hypothetical protein
MLAEVTRTGKEETLRLRPGRHQSAQQVLVTGRRSLHCRRCGGRALVELFDHPIEQVQAETRGKRYPIA